jgi:hypothetical protein
MIKIINDNGRIWAVRVVRKGKKYGLDNCLTHGEDVPLVEFYDCRYEHTPLGQFVSRYYLTTLLQRYPLQGLCLDGGIPAWNIDGKAMDRIVAWLKTL